MAEAYEEYGNYKWQRRAKKRKKSLENVAKHKNKISSSSASRKTIFIVTVITADGNKSFDIPGHKYVGDPKEFQEIKRMCIERYGEDVQVLNIKTR